jgi:hypothetical protein
MVMMALNKAQGEKMKQLKASLKLTTGKRKRETDMDYEPTAATRHKKTTTNTLTPRSKVRRWLHFQSRLYPQPGCTAAGNSLSAQPNAKH